MYTSTRISEDSYKQLQYLLKRAFGAHHSLQSLQQKYDTSMFGESHVGILAEDEHKDPAAYYGVFPMTLQYQAKDYLIAQSGYTMTSPAHQKKGLFTRLAAETYDLARNLGVKLIFGFPNKNSYPGFKNKLNWIFTGNMQNFSMNTSAIPFCELASKVQFLQPLYHSFARIILSRKKVNPSEDIINKFHDPISQGQIKKDINFFNYKLRDKCNHLIEENGFLLLIKPEPHLMIGAVGYFEKEQTKKFIKTVKRLAKKLGCKKAIFIVSENHWLYQNLKSEITPAEDLPIGFYMIDESIKPENISFTLADYDTF